MAYKNIKGFSIKKLVGRWLNLCHQFGELFFNPLGRMELKEAISVHLWIISRYTAGIHRRLCGGKTRIIAVVGSYGKTTTTRLTAAVLNTHVYHHQNRNSLGHLASILHRIHFFVKYAVLEVGIEKKGQMKAYARMIKPDITLVTSIGTEHQRSLLTLESTRHEKAEMLRILNSRGIAILNGDDMHVRWMKNETRARVIMTGLKDGNDIQAENIRLNWPEGMSFDVKIGDNIYPVRSKLLGRHQVNHLLLAIAAGISQGIDIYTIISRAQSVEPTPGRLEAIRLPSGAYILRDDSKSSWETMNSAFDLLESIPATDKVAVLADISEPPGSQGPLYKEIGIRLSGIVSRLIVVGSQGQKYSAGLKYFLNPEFKLIKAGHDMAMAVRILKEILQPGAVVLIKGRNTQKLGRISLALLGFPVQCAISLCKTRVTDCRSCPMLNRPWKGFTYLLTDSR